MKKKEVKNAKSANPYGNFRPADSAFLNKIDAKMATFQKNNKKYPLEFYGNAKAFVLNVINVKHQGRVDNLPKTLADLVSDRDIDRLYQGFLSDTKNVGKVLFSEEMSIEEICACAIEYVRICSSNFDHFNGEGEKQPQCALAESVAKSYNGVLSFYFGVADDTDRAQLMARLINVGIDIKHKIAYAECVVDSMGVPICQIVDFSGKPVIAISCYNGVAKTYTNAIKKLSSMYKFLDFSEHIPMARKRALKTLVKFHNFKSIIPRTGNIENAIVGLSKNAVKNMSSLTASEMNLLVNVDKKVFKVSTLVEVALYERQVDYEVVPDLFEEKLYSFKLNVPGSTRFKIFPNKIVDLDYKLTEESNYILNKRSSESSSESEGTSDFSSSYENESHDYQEHDYEESVNDVVYNNTQSQKTADINLDNIIPVPAAQVLEQMKVKFQPPAGENEFLLDGSRIKLTEKQIENAMHISPLELEDMKSVDMDAAERERLQYEKEVGQLPDNYATTQNVNQKSTNQKKKSFYDVLDEIADKIDKNRTKKLQQAYQDLEKSGELNYNQNNTQNITQKTEEIVKQPNAVKYNYSEPVKESPKVENIVNPQAGTKPKNVSPIDDFLDDDLEDEPQYNKESKVDSVINKNESKAYDNYAYNDTLLNNDELDDIEDEEDVEDNFREDDTQDFYNDYDDDIKDEEIDEPEDSHLDDYEITSQIGDDEFVRENDKEDKKPLVQELHSEKETKDLKEPNIEKEKAEEQVEISEPQEKSVPQNVEIPKENAQSKINVNVDNDKASVESQAKVEPKTTAKPSTAPKPIPKLPPRIPKLPPKRKV